MQAPENVLYAHDVAIHNVLLVNGNGRGALPCARQPKRRTGRAPVAGRRGGASPLQRRVPQGGLFGAAAAACRSALVAPQGRFEYVGPAEGAPSATTGNVQPRRPRGIVVEPQHSQSLMARACT